MDRRTERDPSGPDARARYEQAWRDLAEIDSAGRSITGRVIEQVDGGLILDIGLRAFLPAPLVDTRGDAELASLVGSELECKIIELDRSRENVVLSRRAVLEESDADT